MKPELIELINNIPFARVCSYGTVAVQLELQYGIQTSGRMVGKVLSALTPHGCDGPWRRVINKQWYISALKLGQRGIIQTDLLELEGIEVNNGFVDMSSYEYFFR